MPPRERQAGRRRRPFDDPVRLLDEVQPTQLVRRPDLPAGAQHGRQRLPQQLRPADREPAQPQALRRRVAALGQGHLPRPHRIQHCHRVAGRLRHPQRLGGLGVGLRRPARVRRQAGQLGEHPGPGVVGQLRGERGAAQPLHHGRDRRVADPADHQRGRGDEVGSAGPLGRLGRRLAPRQAVHQPPGEELGGGEPDQQPGGLRVVRAGGPQRLDRVPKVPDRVVEGERAFGVLGGQDGEVRRLPGGVRPGAGPPPVRGHLAGQPAVGRRPVGEHLGRAPVPGRRRRRLHRPADPVLQQRVRKRDTVLGRPAEQAGPAPGPQPGRDRDGIHTADLGEHGRIRRRAEQREHLDHLALGRCQPGEQAGDDELQVALGSAVHIGRRSGEQQRQSTGAAVHLRHPGTGGRPVHRPQVVPDIHCGQRSERHPGHRRVAPDVRDGRGHLVRQRVPVGAYHQQRRRTGLRRHPAEQLQ